MPGTELPPIYYYQIAIKRICRKGAPDRWSPVDFKPGDVFTCYKLGYPGEPLPYGRVNDSWDFWEDYDIDAALIFKPEDISEIRCYRRSRWAEILSRPDVPVPVIWQEEAQSCNH